MEKMKKQKEEASTLTLMMGMESLWILMVMMERPLAALSRMVMMTVMEGWIQDQVTSRLVRKKNEPAQGIGVYQGS